MRPSAIFEEYEEIDFISHIQFKGKLKMKYEYIPKSQLAFSILGNKPYTSYKIKKKCLNVEGFIRLQVIEIREDDNVKVGKLNLNRGDVRTIRKLYKSGLTQTNLAQRYDVHQTVMSRIIARKSPYNFE